MTYLRSALVLLFTVTVAGCGNAVTQDPGTKQSSEPPSVAPSETTTDPVWVEPATYEYTLTASCGLYALNGEFGLVVEDGEVVVVEPLDETARSYVEFDDVAPPTIGELLDLAERARSESADVVDVVVDPSTGQPRDIDIDYDLETIDDERCFSIGDANPLPALPEPDATATGGPLPVQPSDVAYSCAGLPFDPEELLAGEDATQREGMLYDALRRVLAEDSGFGEYPPGPWFEIGQTEDTAQFLAAYPDGFDSDGVLGVYLILELESGEWNWRGAGQCRPTAYLPEYGPATWALDSASLTPDATTFTAQVTELVCASGQSSEGRVQDPVVQYWEDTVVVTFFVESLTGDQNCQGNPSTPVEVELTQPLGGRQLLDGGLWPRARRG
ncbi:MAG: DUF6174 domain-containing protein [Euzebya sp.]